MFCSNEFLTDENIFSFFFNVSAERFVLLLQVILLMWSDQKIGFLVLQFLPAPHKCYHLHIAE